MCVCVCARRFLLQCLMSHLSRKFSYSPLCPSCQPITHNGNRFQKTFSYCTFPILYASCCTLHAACHAHSPHTLHCPAVSGYVYCIIAQMMCLHYHINVTCLAPFVCPLDATLWIYSQPHPNLPPLLSHPQTHNRLFLFALGLNCGQDSTETSVWHSWAGLVCLLQVLLLVLVVLLVLLLALSLVLALHCPGVWVITSGVACYLLLSLHLGCVSFITYDRLGAHSNFSM